MEDYMIPCMNKKIFGIECPGCGSQRALWLVMQGEFIAAFKMFPAIYTLILFFIFLFLHFVDKSRSYQKIIITLAVLNGAIMVVSYVYKHFI